MEVRQANHLYVSNFLLSRILRTEDRKERNKASPFRKFVFLQEEFVLLLLSGVWFRERERGTKNSHWSEGWISGSI